MNDIDLATDGWFKASIGTLWFCGACYALLGLACPAIFLLGLFAPDVPDEDKIGLIVTVIILVPVGLACAVGNFATAWGLARRKKWAYVVSVIIAAMYLTSACLPFGGIILYAMLRGGVKEKYEAECAARAI